MMKKHCLRKIIASSILSLSMVVSAGLAFTSMNNNGYASAAIFTVSAESYASSIGKSTGATAAGGSFNYESYGPEKSDTTYNFTRCGVRLTGGAGSTFDLGLIDISKSDWNGTQSTITGKFASFLEFAYLPSTDLLGIKKYELAQFTITLTDAADSDNKMFIYVESTDPNSNSDTDPVTTYVKAMASGQDAAGAYRYNKAFVGATGNQTTGYVQKNVIVDTTNITAQMPWKNNQGFRPYGFGTQPMAFIFDKADNTLYSQVTFNKSNDELSKSFAIRCFNEGTYQDGIAKSTDKPWAGFKSDLVNVSIKFDTLSKDATSTSIVVTSLGGVAATKTGEEVIFSYDDAALKVIPVQNKTVASVGEEFAINVPSECATAFYKDAYTGDRKVEILNNGSSVKTFNNSDITDNKVNYTFANKGVYTVKITCGTYVCEYKVTVMGSEYNSSLINYANGIEASDGALATNGTYTYNPNYAFHGSQVTKTQSHEGIKLTGGTGSTFNLGTVSLKNSKWVGRETAISGKYSSFFDFVYLPTAASVEVLHPELTCFTLKLADVNNPENFMEIEFKAEDHNDSTEHIAMLAIRAKASNQAELGAYRAGAGFKTASEGRVSKEYILAAANEFANGVNQNVVFRPNGDCEYPVSLVYDNNTLFSNITFTNSDQLGKSFAIRNFAERYADGITSTDKPWKGFSSDFVNATITFNNVAVDQTSIVVTGISGVKLTNDEFKPSYEDDCLITSASSVSANYGVEFELPSVSVINPFIKNVAFDGTYEILDKTNAVVASGNYEGAKKVTVNGFGNYTVKYTDVYNRSISLPLNVSAVLTVKTGNNVTVKVCDQVITDNQRLYVTDDITFNVSYGKGYTLGAVKFNDVAGFASTNEFTVRASDITQGVNELVINAKVINYNLNYKVYNDSGVAEDYNAQNKNFSMTDVNLNAKLEVLADKNGKQFKGWYLNGVKVEYFKELPLEDGLVLYGVYGEPTSKVTFNDGVSDTVQEVKEGESASAYVPVKDGYVFDGWYTDENCTTKYDFNSSLNGDVTLYAKWTQETLVGGETVNNSNVTVNASMGEVASSVNALQVVLIVVFGLGVAAAIATGVLFFLKKRKN